MLYEKQIDREREHRAMLVMQSALGCEFRKTKPKSPIDFVSVDDGYVCEHKYRHYKRDAIKSFGSIWLEKSKYEALMSAAIERWDDPLFVVTIRDGTVLYCRVLLIDTRRTVVARRHHYRCEYDEDLCYEVPLELFKIAGYACGYLW